MSILEAKDKNVQLMVQNVMVVGMGEVIQRCNIFGLAEPVRIDFVQLFSFETNFLGGGATDLRTTLGNLNSRIVVGGGKL